MGLLSKITEMPWQQTGLPDEGEHRGEFGSSAKKVALIMFLAVVTSVFFLFFMAYLERMELSDWYPVEEPGILWINSLFLVLGSIAMQRARRLAAAEEGSIVLPLLIGGLFTIAFLAGQFVAWDQLRSNGLYAATNPASAFFYLLTALHGLHLAGGLYVWARTLLRSRSGAETARVRESVELCSVYWHYLLLVWLLLFALMLNT